MIKKEHEFKMMLTKDEHHFLLRFFDKLIVESGLQINYYYDTSDEVIRKRDGAFRVRQKNNNLIDTIKRHLDTGNCSIEGHVQEDTFMRVIMWNGLQLWLKGSLRAVRMVFKVCDGTVLMLIEGLLKKMQQRSFSKSERFFWRLSILGGTNYA